jgi:hypothetical protein
VSLYFHFSRLRRHVQVCKTGRSGLVWQ